MTNLMPISGLILTIQDSARADALVQDLLSHEARLEFGKLQGCHLPAVLETATAHESRQVHEWLCEQPGILGVDVVFVGADENIAAAEGDANA